MSGIPVKKKEEEMLTCLKVVPLENEHDEEEHGSKPEPQWRSSDAPPHHQLRNPSPETFPPRLLHESISISNLDLPPHSRIHTI
jgi:hypothetical protein